MASQITAVNAGFFPPPNYIKYFGKNVDIFNWGKSKLQVPSVIINALWRIKKKSHGRGLAKKKKKQTNQPWKMQQSPLAPEIKLPVVVTAAAAAAALLPTEVFSCHFEQLSAS